MSTCARARGQLASFVGGDLTQSAADGVREHLMTCRSCRGEAASLQQATAALRSFSQAQLDGVDDGMFAAMHGDIVAAVVEADVAREHHRLVARRWLVAAAAMLLAAIGFWLGQGDHEPSVWRRQPLSTPVDLEDAVIVVPTAGSSVPIRSLSDEWWPDWTDAPGQAGGLSGMRGRLRLRTLVDERMLPQEPPR